MASLGLSVAPTGSLLPPPFYCWKVECTYGCPGKNDSGLPNNNADPVWQSPAGFQFDFPTGPGPGRTDWIRMRTSGTTNEFALIIGFVCRFQQTDYATRGEAPAFCPVNNQPARIAR